MYVYKVVDLQCTYIFWEELVACSCKALKRVLFFLENAARNNSEIHKLSDEYKSRTVKLASELSKTKQESAMQVRHMLADCIKSKRINSITAKLSCVVFVPVISNSPPSLDLKGQYDYDFFFALSLLHFRLRTKKLAQQYHISFISRI